jgi:hypothetical protein
MARNPYLVHACLSSFAFGVVFPLGICLLGSAGAFQSSGGKPTTSKESMGQIRAVEDFRAAQPDTNDQSGDELLAARAVRE